MKIHQAMSSCLPHTCKYIKKAGFDCNKDCGAKSPFGLIFTVFDVRAFETQSRILLMDTPVLT
jgi:hypothetical protein